MVLLFQVRKISTTRTSPRGNDQEHEEEVEEDTSTSIPLGAVE
jgi:hypothetical protein